MRIIQGRRGTPAEDQLSAIPGKDAFNLHKWIFFLTSGHYLPHRGGRSGERKRMKVSLAAGITRFLKEILLRGKLFKHYLQEKEGEEKNGEIVFLYKENRQGRMRVT